MTASPRPAGSGCLTVLLVLALPLLYGNYVAGRAWWHERQLQQQGRTVQAELLDAGTAPGPRGMGRTYGLTYRLPADVDPGGTRHHVTVPESLYQAAVQTRRLPVQVLPGRPQVQRPEGHGGSGLLWWMLALDAVFLVAFFVIRSGA